MKDCKLCGNEFDKDAHGPWCHACVMRILTLLAISQLLVVSTVELVETLRNQAREAVKEGRGVETTEIPGPFWGLNLR